jgi:hypothetical protein
LTTCWNLLSAFDDIKEIPQKSGNFGAFFSQKSLIWVGFGHPSDENWLKK